MTSLPKAGNHDLDSSSLAPHPGAATRPRSGHLLTPARAALTSWDSPERALAPRSEHAVAARRDTDLSHQDLRFLRAAFGNMLDPVVVCDQYGRITLINHAMEVFAGLDPSGLLPEPWSEYGELFQLDGTPIAVDNAPLSRALRGETVHDVELIIVAKSGRRRTMIADGEPLFDSDGELLGAMVVWHDITDRRHAEDRLAFVALHDRLTGLPNRTLFVDLIRSGLDRAPALRGSTAVLAINIDHFADIATRLGDRSGNHSGEQLVSEVARRLETSLRRTDRSRPLDTVAHQGGDQFLILCEDIADAGAAMVIAKRIASALAQPMSIAGEDLTVTAGIGITLTRDPLRDPEPLIREAEAAMHRAKLRGAGRHEMFSGEMHAQRLVRMANEGALRQALAKGEFYVEYQPKVSLVTDRTVGVEALLRWNHPQRGLISPLDFIPLAEESGLIVPIGAWVLEQVCLDAKRWRRALPGNQPLMVAVNVSPRQFESGLAATFGTIIGTSGIDPATVCLEVTESMVMQDAELAIATLRELKTLGLSISVDDFGTGFSSLAYLKRFPLDELKIDKSFVDGLGRDFEATAIVAAVMGMAHALDLRVVAEGVETADQVVRLRTLGCDEAQGFFYARPGSAAAIDDRLLVEARACVGGHSQRSAKANESALIGKVLVVDDAVDVRQLARSSLAAVGFEVREAPSGEVAITMARHFRPDCVVLDVNLPGISGFDVCRVLREDPANQRTTIVILTGDAAPSEKVMAFSLEADDYMVKPFSPRDLVSRVTSAIRLRSEMFAAPMTTSPPHSFPQLSVEVPQ
jgi:diguanylate cyclase (GGDEF)-like protein/PAS domain S-box-containing protein